MIGWGRIAALALALAPSAAHAAAPPPAAAPAAKPAAPPAAGAATPTAGGANDADIERQLDQALERFYAKKYDDAAGKLYAALRTIPENDLKRDTAAFYLALSLTRLGLTQGALEHFVDVAVGRRAPELVGRSLSELDTLTRQRLVDEPRLVDEILFGNQYGDLPPDTSEFVQYYQALGELRRGYTDWGTRGLETLSRSRGYYGWKGRYALGVERLSQGNEEGTEKLLRGVVDASEAPNDIRNDARLALARQRYEKKKYDEAFDLYKQVDSPLPLQDLVLLEKAWDRVAASDEQRGLGMVVSLGAPIFKRLFAPERSLISAVALKRLCQFRASHLAVLDFRERYGDLVARIRERLPLSDDPLVKKALLGRDDLVPERRIQRVLEQEKGWLGRVSDGALREHLNTIYTIRLAKAAAEVGRRVERATEHLTEELLRIDEQMTILDYEIGVGLFKGSGEDKNAKQREVHRKIPYGSEQVYYRFDGEYWSDELQDLAVFADDRCVR